MTRSAAGYIGEMPNGTFERRSIVLVLQELADKTPAGEPLLITGAEMVAYRKFLATRAVPVPMPRADMLSDQYGVTSEPAFNGRPLRIIPEGMLIPKREMLSKVSFTGEEIRNSTQSKGAFVRAAKVDESNTKIRYLLNKLREVFGQDQLSPADVAQINKLVEGGPAAEVSRVELELADRLRELQLQADDQREMNRQANAAAQSPMFVGEDAKQFPAEEAEYYYKQRRLGLANAAQQQMNAMANQAVEGNYAGIQRDPRAPWKAIPAEPGLNIEYRSGSNELNEPAFDRSAFDAIVARGIPDEAKLDPETFRAYMFAQMAMERSRPQQKKQQSSSTVKTIPVGVSRSYFEE